MKTKGKQLSFERDKRTLIRFPVYYFFFFWVDRRIFPIDREGAQSNS